VFDHGKLSLLQGTRRTESLPAVRAVHNNVCLVAYPLNNGLRFAQPIFSRLVYSNGIYHLYKVATLIKTLDQRD
jgi:hypothetical protein